MILQYDLDKKAKALAVCGIPGCYRETWNSKEGAECCRTCKSTNGTKHGPICDAREILASSGQAGCRESTNRITMPRKAWLMPTKAWLVATSKAWEKQAGALVLAFAVCSVVGCCRETWNSKEGEECCRTCKSSNGARHGPVCDAHVAAVSETGSTTPASAGNGAPADDASAGRPRTFYHATNLKAALSIQDKGFRVPAGPGGCLGPGMYCTTTLKKAFDYLKCEHGGIVFELDVDLGRCKKLDANDPLMKTWQQHGYDPA